MDHDAFLHKWAVCVSSARTALLLGYRPAQPKLAHLSSLLAVHLLPMDMQREFFTRVAAPWKRYCDECPMLEAHRRGLSPKEAEEQATNAATFQRESWDIIHDLLKQRPRNERRAIWHRIREATRSSNVCPLPRNDSGARTRCAA